MNKILVPALLLLSVSSVAMAVEPDTRSAWAKSQDMYVEPTLRMKQVETITAIDKNNQPTGEVVIKAERETVFGPDGQQKMASAPTGMAPAPMVPAGFGMTPPMQTTPVVTPQVQDLSRPMKQ